MTNRRSLLLAGGATASAVIGILANSWTLLVLGAMIVILLLTSRLSSTRAASRASRTLLASAFFASLGVGLLGLGSYAAIEGESRISGAILFVASLFPAAYFLFISWSLMYLGIRGKRPRGADRVSTFLSLANRPLFNRRKRRN